MVRVAVGVNSPGNLGSTGKSSHLQHQPYQDPDGNCLTLDKLYTFKGKAHLCSRLVVEGQGRPLLKQRHLNSCGQPCYNQARHHWVQIGQNWFAVQSNVPGKTMTLKQGLGCPVSHTQIGIDSRLPAGGSWLLVSGCRCLGAPNTA